MKWCIGCWRNHPLHAASRWGCENLLTFFWWSDLKKGCMSYTFPSCRTVYGYIWMQKNVFPTLSIEEVTVHPGHMHGWLMKINELFTSFWFFFYFLFFSNFLDIKYLFFFIKNFLIEVFLSRKFLRVSSSTILYILPLSLSDHTFPILPSSYLSISFWDVLFYFCHLVASLSKMSVVCYFPFFYVTIQYL